MASDKVLYKAKDGTLINLSTKVINNTTTDSTTDALSAAQGKVLASKFTTLTKSSVGLGNVDNTADANKSVKYATTAGSANAVTWDNVTDKPSTFTPASHTHSQYALDKNKLDKTPTNVGVFKKSSNPVNLIDLTAGVYYVPSNVAECAQLFNNDFLGIYDSGAGITSSSSIPVKDKTFRITGKHKEKMTLGMSYENVYIYLYGIKNNIINFPYNKSNLVIHCVDATSRFAYSLVSDTNNTIKYDDISKFTDYDNTEHYITHNGTEYYYAHSMSLSMEPDSSILASLIYVTEFPKSNLKYIRVYPASLTYCPYVYHGISDGKTITWRQIPNT